MPPTPFAVFEPTLDPGSQSIPSHIGLHAGQVGHHKPGFAVARVPTRQEGARQLASSGCKAGNRTRPPLTDAADHLRQRAKGRRALRAILPLAIDTQEGMPSQALNRCKEPVGVQPTIGEDNDGPSGGTLPCKWGKQASQCGRQAPGRVAFTTSQATGNAEPPPPQLITKKV